MSAEPAASLNGQRESERGPCLADVELPARWWGRPLAETRWSLELSRLVVDPVFAGRGVPRGDGRPVLLMPGFLAGDQTLLVLAGWLYRIGYRPRLCGFIANGDCSDRAIDRAERRLESIAARDGRRVALIGHSRGGHYARALATRRPELVSHAISLGADLNGMFACSTPTLKAVSGMRVVLRRTGRARAPECLSEVCRCRFTSDFYAPFPADAVNLTSVYSRGDGVVQWETQLVPYADCVEVTGSHVGLVFNRKSYRAIAAALAAPELPSRSAA
jgi:pimeloyl-ACP methyl ester carboxylesterase